jgi:hypothetical protein
LRVEQTLLAITLAGACHELATEDAAARWKIESGSAERIASSAALASARSTLS